MNNIDLSNVDKIHINESIESEFAHGGFMAVRNDNILDNDTNESHSTSFLPMLHRNKGKISFPYVFINSEVYYKNDNYLNMEPVAFFNSADDLADFIKTKTTQIVEDLYYQLSDIEKKYTTISADYLSLVLKDYDKYVVSCPWGGNNSVSFNIVCDPNKINTGDFLSDLLSLVDKNGEVNVNNSIWRAIRNLFEATPTNSKYLGTLRGGYLVHGEGTSITIFKSEKIYKRLHTAWQRKNKQKEIGIMYVDVYYLNRYAQYCINNVQKALYPSAYVKHHNSDIYYFRANEIANLLSVYKKLYRLSPSLRVPNETLLAMEKSLKKADIEEGYIAKIILCHRAGRSKDYYNESINSLRAIFKYFKNRRIVKKINEFNTKYGNIFLKLDYNKIKYGISSEIARCNKMKTILAKLKYHGVIKDD